MNPPEADPIDDRPVAVKALNDGDLATANWPTVDPTELKKKPARTRYERLEKAMLLYLGGGSAKDAATLAGISRRRFQRLVARCRSVASDGRLVGFRGLVEGWRSRVPKRTKPFTSGRTLSTGYAGLFTMFLQENVVLREDLEQRLLRKGKKILEPNRIVGRVLRRLLVAVCEAHGILNTEYPLNTTDKGLKALRRWIVRVLLPKHARALASAQFGVASANIMTDAVDEPSGQPLKAYGAWQIDEYTIDLRTKYEILNEGADWDEVELERFQVIRAIDVGTGTNVSWQLVLAKQATAIDVGNVLWSGITGRKAPQLTIPWLVRDPGAGYPASEFPKLEFLVPKVIYLDNALAHLSNEVGYIVSKAWGGELRLGRPRYPLGRPNVESRIGQSARRLIHQLPGTTGSRPTPENARNRSLPTSNLVRANELEQLIDVELANENATPHSSANGIAPLERLRRLLVAGQIGGIVVPVLRRKPHFFFAPKRVRVHVDLKGGRKPYINFLRVRYSSPLLQKRFDLAGKYLILRVDYNDLRIVVLFLEDGTELGTVRAQGRWGIVPHDHRIRKMAFSLVDAAQLSRMPQDGPLDALYQHLRSGAPMSRSFALQQAYVLEYLRRHLSPSDGDEVWSLSDDAGQSPDRETPQGRQGTEVSVSLDAADPSAGSHFADQDNLTSQQDDRNPKPQHSGPRMAIRRQT